MKNKLTLLTLFAISFFIGVPTTFAQSFDVNLTVSPPVSYLHVAPGSATNHTIILENSGDHPITVMPSIVDFTTDGKTGQVIVTNQLTFPYVSMGEDEEVNEITVPPQKKAQLRLYINVPEDAQEKEYPMSVLFFSNSESNSGQNKTNSQISAAIGSNLVVLVAKQNTFNKVLEVLDVNAPKIVDSFQKLEFEPLVKNNSFGAVSASGSAKVVNWRKQTIAEFEIYPDTILGHNSRELRALLSNSNLEKPEVGSFLFKPKFMIGPHQIIVTLMSEENKVITQTVHVFFALPIAVIITAVIGIGIYIYFSKK